VHPQQQLRVAGVVAQPGDRVDPLDAAVDVVDRLEAASASSLVPKTTV
jgi:hypothetical protein